MKYTAKHASPHELGVNLMQAPIRIKGPTCVFYTRFQNTGTTTNSNIASSNQHLQI